MTATHDPISETDLLAYVDGHLEPTRRRVVDEFLAEDAEAAQRIAEDMAIMDGIRALFDRHYHEPVPQELQAVLEPRPRRRGTWRTLSRAAAALVLMAAGAAGGWLGAQDEATIHALVSAGQSERGPVRAISAAGERAQAPAETLGESLRNGLRVPDLTAAGLKLVSQTLVGAPERPAVQLTYEDARGGRIHLFQQARNDDVAPQTQPRRSDGHGVVYWAEGPFVFAITGEMSSEDLQLLAQAAQKPNATAQRRDGIVPVVNGRR